MQLFHPGLICNCGKPEHGQRLDYFYVSGNVYDPVYPVKITSLGSGVRRRGYFKHFNDAYSGNSINKAMKEKRYFEVNLFWALLGRANQLGAAEFTEEIAYFCRLLHVTPAKLCRVLPEFLQTFESFSIEIQQKNVRISISNYTKYQESRGQKTNKNAAKKEPIKIKDKRLKIKDNNYITCSKSPLSDTDFLEIYKLYPRKIGKAKGLQKCKAQIKTKEDLECLKKAVEVYKSICQKEGTEKQYIKHFSTFMNCWRDYLDDDIGQTDSFKRTSSDYVREMLND